MDLNDLRSDPLNLFTALLWGEARGEDGIGKLAVAFVVDNRMHDSRWPNTYQGVILQPSQFSCMLEDDPNYPEVLKAAMPSHNGNWGDPAWLECRWAAQTVIGRHCRDITGGANHYCTYFVIPSWIRGEEPIFEWGNHRFYKL